MNGGGTFDQELVRTTADIGEVLGVDGQDYHLQEGDVLRLPAVNAGPLIEKDAAVRLTGFGPATTDATSQSVSAEAEAVVGFEPSKRRPLPALRWEFADWCWQQHQADQADEHDDDTDLIDVDLMAAAMGDPDEASKVALEDESELTGSTGSSSRNGGLPTGALPLAQLDALAPHERRRAAQRRGLHWPTTEEARDRSAETIHEDLRHKDDRVVDAPTSLGEDLHHREYALGRAR